VKIQSNKNPREFNLIANGFHTQILQWVQDKAAWFGSDFCVRHTHRMCPHFGLIRMNSGAIAL